MAMTETPFINENYLSFVVERTRGRVLPQEEITEITYFLEKYVVEQLKDWDLIDDGDQLDVSHLMTYDESEWRQRHQRMVTEGRARHWLPADGSRAQEAATAPVAEPAKAAEVEEGQFFRNEEEFARALHNGEVKVQTLEEFFAEHNPSFVPQVQAFMALSPDEKAARIRENARRFK